MQPAVRYSLEDVVELPDLVTRNIDVQMTAEQKKVYDGIVRHCQALAQSKQIDAANAAVAMGKLLQIAGGWVYAGDREVASLDAKPRIKALVDTIIGCSRKVIVFAPFTHCLDGIADALKKEAISFAQIDGRTSEQRRAEIFNNFQNTSPKGTWLTQGSFKVLLAHPRTMAHGVTLTAADTILWFLPITSLEIYEQANARIRRIGQKHKQQIIHLVAAPVERRIYSLLRTRQKVQDKFLDLFANATQLLA
jgi:SNF2 family DNA or RNA helicase